MNAPSANALDGIRTVFCQFSFTNQNAVPPGLRREPDQDLLGNQIRKSMPLTGVQFIAPTEQVDISGFSIGLCARGFKLVDAFFHRVEKLNQRSPRREYYWRARFVFSRDNSCNTCEDYDVAFLRICNESFWRVRAFRNENRGNPGTYHISVNMEVRVPRLLPNGDKVVARLKDESGMPYGDPMPICGKGHLVVWDDSICLAD